MRSVTYTENYEQQRRRQSDLSERFADINDIVNGLGCLDEPSDTPQGQRSQGQRDQ